MVVFLVCTAFLFNKFRFIACAIKRLGEDEPSQNSHGHSVLKLFVTLLIVISVMACIGSFSEREQAREKAERPGRQKPLIGLLIIMTNATTVYFWC